MRPEQIRHGVVTLDPRQTRHVAAVLRLRAGDEVIIVTGEGSPQVAQLDAVQGSRATARLLRPAPAPPGEPWALTLAAALPRRHGGFDQIVDQATQVGVAVIVPMITARSVAHLDPANGSTRRRRWQRLADAAAEQSGRATIPRLAPAATLSAVLGRAAEYDRLLMPTVGAPARPVAEWLSSSPRRILLLVGPEGDFTPEEITASTQAGAIPISLGYNVLRCETATVVALAILTHAIRHGSSPPK